MIYFVATAPLQRPSPSKVFAVPDDALFARTALRVQAVVPGFRIHFLDDLPAGVPVITFTPEEVC